MTTIRVQHVGKFVVIANATVCDSRLSWEARGLLVYLLSKPDDWRVRLGDLMAQGSAGERKVNRILAELKLNGYMTRRRIKTADGRFDWDTVVFETPDLALESTIPTKRRHGTIPTSATDGASRHGSARDGARSHIARPESLNTEEQRTEERMTEASAVGTSIASASGQEALTAGIYEQEFQRRLKPKWHHELHQLEIFHGAEVVAAAIQDCRKNHPDPAAIHNPTAFLRAVLHRWSEDGVPAEAQRFVSRQRGPVELVSPCAGVAA